MPCLSAGLQFGIGALNTVFHFRCVILRLMIGHVENLCTQFLIDLETELVKLYTLLCNCEPKNALQLHPNIFDTPAHVIFGCLAQARSC